MTNEQRRLVVEAFTHGVDEDKFESTIHSILSNHLQPSFLSTTKIQALANNNNHNGFVKVFAGGGSPPISSDYQSYQVASSSVKVHHLLCPIDEMSDYVPLSTGCFDNIFHGVKIVESFITAIERAIGKRGLFPVRHRSSHHGSATYIGERAENSQAQPSPSEGPGVHGRFYYRNFIDHSFWPFCLSLFNKLGSCASRLDWYVYKFMAVLYPFANDCMTKLRYCRLLIVTMNFECTVHVDVVDEVKSAQDNMLADLQTIIDDPLIDGKWLKEAEHAESYLQCHGLSTPTTCCYQFVHGYDDIEIIQFFCLPSLGICYQIKSFWAHCFMAACFSHLTSTPIYVLKGKVYVGKIPNVTIFAWGKGGPAKKRRQR